jgi:peptidoglycan/xylan/chitin deacetylase (PgdA/CDA1 family)
MSIRVTLLLTFLFFRATAQQFDQATGRYDTAYQLLKEKIIMQFRNASPGQFGPFIKGVDEDIKTDRKIMALTFDACGGPHGNGYDADLIDFLRREKIPATLFLTGLWMDAHADQVRELSAIPLFEIENHGLTHHPCAIAGETKYGIQGTTSVGQAVDEIELNARKIEFMTHRKPLYYRSATATTDEACTAIARYLGETIISYDLLSGDAVAGTPKSVIRKNLLRGAKNGAIVIMHMNHPEWNGYEALKEVLPVWRKKGFTFVKIENHSLAEKNKL